MKILAVLMASLGALLVALGVGLVFLPAGLIVGGLEALSGAYGITYVMVRKSSK